MIVCDYMHSEAIITETIKFSVIYFVVGLSLCMNQHLNLKTFLQKVRCTCNLQPLLWNITNDELLRPIISKGLHNVGCTDDVVTRAFYFAP